MRDTAETRTGEAQEKQLYHEPLLIRHEPLRNLTGQKYGEKKGFEKTQVEG